MVVHFSQDAVNVQVDSGLYPDRWREEPYFSKLVRMVAQRHHEERKPRLCHPRRRVVTTSSCFSGEPSPRSAVRHRVPACRGQKPSATGRQVAEHLQRLHERVGEIQRVREEFGYCAIPDDEVDPVPALSARPSAVAPLVPELRCGHAG